MGGQPQHDAGHRVDQQLDAPSASAAPTAAELARSPAATSGSTITIPISTNASCTSQPSGAEPATQPGSGPNRLATQTTGTRAGPSNGEPHQRPAGESAQRASNASARAARASSIGWPHISGSGTTSSKLSDWLTQTQYRNRL